LRSRDAEGRFGGWWGAPAPAAASASAGAGTAGASDDEDDETAEGSTGKNPRGGKDPNDRGRGRTLETQGAGVALLAAWWEFEGL
jgi:hypothetical protein